MIFDPGLDSKTQVTRMMEAAGCKTIFVLALEQSLGK